MKKFQIWEEELYPVYYPTYNPEKFDEDYVTHEVDDETFARLDAAEKEWEWAQRFLKELEEAPNA